MPGSSETFTRLGIILILIPVTLFVLWIYANSRTNGYPDNVELYKSYFPSLLRGRFTLTILSIIFCIGAGALCAGNLNNPKRSEQIISGIVVIISVLLGCLNLFSMM